MSQLNEILEYNRTFVKEKKYEKYATSRFPNKKMVILTCMDTRLVELLPRAMNLRNGDAKIIKNAGAIVTQPFGNVMRSIIVAIYALNAEEVCVVGHHDCGMTGLDSKSILEDSVSKGVSPEILKTLKHSGINLNRWLTGFESVTDGVEGSVEIIRNHPLLPNDVSVHGLIIDPTTGKLDALTEG